MFSKNVSAQGKAEIWFGIIRARFNRVCDYDLIYPYWKCDLRVYFQGLVFGRIKMNSLDIIEIMAKRLELDGVIDTTYWRQMGVDISSTKIITGSDNTETLGPSPMYIHITNVYYQEYGLCAYVVDLSNFGYESNLLGFCYLLYARFPNKTVVKKTHSKDYAYRHVYLATKVKVNCIKNYFQPSCWLKCIDTPNRFTCKNDGGESCLHFWEEISFRYLYQRPSIGLMFWNNVELFITRCIFWNPCNFRMEKTIQNCLKPYELCFPIYNATFTCSKFDPLYVLSISPGNNFTFNSLVNGENLKVFVTLTGLHKESLKNHSFCKWRNTDNYTKNDFDEITIPYMLFIFGKTRNMRFHFEIHCTIGEFRSFVFYKFFDVHIQPTYIKLQNLSYGNGENVYLGQILTCYCNAIPSKLSELILNIQSLNFRVSPLRPVLREIEIPYHARLGFCKFNCSFTFIFPDGRPYKRRYEVFNMNIRSYIYFSWNKPYKNVYYITDYAGCDFLAFFTGKIIVTQIKGINKIQPVPVKNFSTNSNIGGLYVFQCLLNSRMTISTFYKIHTIEIFTMPNMVCLSLHLPVPGYFLHCGHDGYPPDQASYVIKLKSSNKLLAHSRNSYVQIPYYLYHTDITFSCQITFFIQNVTKKIEIIENLKMIKTSSEAISYTEDDVICANYVDVPIQNVIELTVGTIVIFNEHNFLDSYKHFDRFPFYCILPIVCFCLLLLVICCIYFIYDSDETFFTEPVRAKICRRMLDDHLLHISREIIIELKEKVGSFYFTERSGSLFSSASSINSHYMKI